MTTSVVFSLRLKSGTLDGYQQFVAIALLPILGGKYADLLEQVRSGRIQTNFQETAQRVYEVLKVHCSSCTIHEEDGKVMALDNEFMPSTVTFSGIDDNTKITDMVNLQLEFPSVEFGVLFSAKKTGTARYPSLTVVEDLKNFPELRLSAHFCGKYTRDVMDGDFSFFKSLPPIFQRIQLNGFNPIAASKVETNNVLQLARENNVRVILQSNGDYLNVKVCQSLAENHTNVEVLIDPSGGRGIYTDTYQRYHGFANVGWAGGIGPDNAWQVVDKLVGQYKYWIDMETNIRTKSTDGDFFDIAKCWSVMRQLKDYQRSGMYASTKKIHAAGGHWENEWELDGLHQYNRVAVTDGQRYKVTVLSTNADQWVLEKL